MNLRSQLEELEGRKYVAYPDPLTHAEPWTIGVGHTGPEVHEGLVWDDTQVDLALDLDIAEALQDCREHFPWFEELNEPRQAVLTGMCFQMGIGHEATSQHPAKGLLGFPRMLGSTRDQRFANAAEEMRQSDWAKQTPKRVRRLAHQLEMGEWA
jgi:lysozyme